MFTPIYLTTIWTAFRTAWTWLSTLLRSRCGPDQRVSALTWSFDALEGVDLLDADEHAVAGVLVGEAGTAFAGRDSPAVRIVGAVFDGHGGDVAEVAHDPLHGTARGDVHAVGAFAVLHWGI